MRKLFLTLLLSVFLAFNVWAISPAFLDLVSSESGSVCDDCSGLLKFAWHMEDNNSTPDVTLGSPCGCSDGDTIGAEIGSPDFSATQKSDGTYSLHINAGGEYYQFAVSADDNIEPDNIKLTFDLYVVTYPADATTINVIDGFKDTSNYLYIRLKGTGDGVEAVYKGNASFGYVNINAVAVGNWVSCEYQARTGISGVDHYLKCGAASDEDDDDLVAMNGSMVSFNHGSRVGSGTGEYYLDNVKVYPCDRY